MLCYVLKSSLPLSLSLVSRVSTLIRALVSLLRLPQEAALWIYDASDASKPRSTLGLSEWVLLCMIKIDHTVCPSVLLFSPEWYMLLSILVMYSLLNWLNIVATVSCSAWSVPLMFLCSIKVSFCLCQGRSFYHLVYLVFSCCNHGLCFINMVEIVWLTLEKLILYVSD